MAKFSVMIFESPYGREKPYTALRFALTALLDGHDVIVILIQDGVSVGKTDQKPAEYPNIMEYLELIENALDNMRNKRNAIIFKKRYGVFGYLLLVDWRRF